jgi:hypothetical protein
MLAALLIAAAVIVGGVMPAEYGVDPTGVGRVLGLTPMGEFKRAIAEELAQAQRAQLEADSLAQLRQSGAGEPQQDTVAVPQKTNDSTPHAREDAGDH